MTTIPMRIIVKHVSRSSAPTGDSCFITYYYLTMLSVVVDLQGFKTERNTFVAKEIAMLANNRDTETAICHWIFEPPYSYAHLSPFEKRQATWLTAHHHWLRWSDGWVPYYRLPEMLARELATVDVMFVKGVEKKTWLSQLLLRTDPTIIDIVEMYEKKKKNDNNYSNDSDSDADDDNDDDNDNEDTDGFDVDDDYCGILPDTVVPNLKPMPATNTVRCAFHNGSGCMCALKTCRKFLDYMWKNLRSA